MGTLCLVCAFRSQLPLANYPNYGEGIRKNRLAFLWLELQWSIWSLFQSACCVSSLSRGCLLFLSFRCGSWLQFIQVWKFRCFLHAEAITCTLKHTCTHAIDQIAYSFVLFASQYDLGLTPLPPTNFLPEATHQLFHMQRRTYIHNACMHAETLEVNVAH